MRSLTIRTLALLLTFAIAVMIDRRTKSPQTRQVVQMWKGVLVDIAEHPIEFLRVLWITISST